MRGGRRRREDIDITENRRGEGRRGSVNHLQ